MKFALVNGEKVEATKGAKGQCPSCGSDLIAKCGELKVNHWAHKGNRNCDPWWENETEWHRSWKDKFPIEWQEVVHFDESGEKHIADVKTQNGWTLEFQHSFLNPEERLSRNTFYHKLVWVVDGTRRKTDKKQFQKILEESTKLRTNIPIVRANFPDECRLLKEWHHNKSLVFFDFKEVEDTEQSMLWFLFPKTPSDSAYLSPFSRASFIELLNKDNFDELFNNTILPIHTEIANGERKQQSVNTHNRTNALSGFDRHMRSKQRRQRRF
jgi:competence protein CoiA